jgi:hypothetical protein
MEPNELVGAWRLCAFELRSKEGDCYYPYGKNPKGLLLYDEHGYMSGMMSKPERPRLSTSDLRLLPEPEKALMADGFSAYSGRYELLEDKILHKIEVSLIQNLVGATEERFFHLDGSRMVLTTPPTSIDGKEYSYQIIWEKIQNR